MNRVFKIDDTHEVYWVVAKSTVEALEEVMKAFSDCKDVDEFIEDVDCVRISICPPGEIITVKDEDFGEISKTASEWAATENGVFCSTAWEEM